MAGYWTRHRLVPVLIVTIVVALITGLLFVFPSISQQAANYNNQSIYKNTDIDFIAPEPSEDQILELSSTNGIDKIFPFYITKTAVNVNGASRTTTILLSDRFENVDITMYNDNRLIEKSSVEYDNPILVDWQFCRETSSGIGDKISFTMSGSLVEYTIYAVYETNSIYDGGAILAHLTAEQKASIVATSKNSGYSGMYISANDYNACRTFLTTDYRPMGRLKNRAQFDSDEQYQTHYDAIMSSSYANEITDFRVRENSLDNSTSSMMIWIGAVLAAAIVAVFNIIMARRGCEKGYFQKQCIPKGRDVISYYKISFIVESILFIIAYGLTLVLRKTFASEYIPSSTISIKLGIVPVAVIAVEIICLIANNLMLAGMDNAYKAELVKAKGEATRKNVSENPLNGSRTVDK